MYVYAKSTHVQRWSGGVARLEKGIAWPKDDPLVKERPDLFSDEPSVVHSTIPNWRPVEEATANPGQRRRVKRAD